MAASLNNACPMCAMEEYMTRDTHWPYQLPRFFISSVEPEAISREYVVQKLQGLTSRAGVGHGI